MDILATANVSVALSPKQVTASLTGNATKVYDAGTALPETHTVRVVLDGVLNGDANALSATADYQFENASAGTKTVTASDIALVDVDPTMGVAGFYELQGSTELTVQVAGGITPLALTEDMFVPIGDQSYTADPITPEVVLTDAYKSILSDADYNLDYNNNTEAGTATVTVTGQGNAQGSVTLTFTINALETQITAEAQDESGSPKTQFTYGDTIRITGSLNAAAPDAYTLRGAAARSGQGQIILYIGNKQIGDPQNVSLNNAAFTFDINTADKSVPTGEVTLILQYTGDGSLGSSETGGSINLDKVVLTPEVQSVPVITKTYDGTATVPSGQAPQITLTGTTVNGDMPALVDPVWSYASSGASDSIDIIGSGLALSEAWQSWYALSTDTLTLPSAGAIEKATLSPQSESVTLPAGIPGVSVTKVISGLVPDNAGGAPVYEVTDYSENGLISASINEQGELILTAKDETDTSMADTVTVKVSGLANYSDITIEVAVAFANQTPVTIELTLSQTTLTYTAQQIQGYSAVNATYTDANGTTQTYTDALSYVYEGTTLEGAAYGPTSTAPTQAGSYTVTASVPETALMYTGSVSRNFTIVPAPLVIRADNVQIVQGQALPALTYTVEGLMGGDTLIKEPVLTPSGLDTSLPGTYTITISGAQASANYTIAEYVNAVLTITEAPAPDPQVPPASGTAIPPETGDSSGFETNISALAGALVISVLAGLWIKRSRIRRKG